MLHWQVQLLQKHQQQQQQQHQGHHSGFEWMTSFATACSESATGSRQASLDTGWQEKGGLHLSAAVVATGIAACAAERAVAGSYAGSCHGYHYRSGPKLGFEGAWVCSVRSTSDNKKS